MPSFDPIVLPSISDLIIQQILIKIKAGELHPGDQLPSEQSMQNSLNVTKQQIKTALKKLEVYRVVETKPQSGSYLADIHQKVLVGLIDNILNIHPEPNPVALLEIRTVLEIKGVELAAIHCTESEVSELRVANEVFNANMHKIQDQEFMRTFDDDIFFHQEIIRFSHSTTLIALYSFITMEIINLWKSFRFPTPQLARKRIQQTYVEHLEILDAIEKKDSARSVIAMKQHLEEVHSLIQKGNK